MAKQLPHLPPRHPANHLLSQTNNRKRKLWQPANHPKNHHQRKQLAPNPNSISKNYSSPSSPPSPSFFCAVTINHQAHPAITDYLITHETKFGGVYIKITIDDFNELGFNYGDSIDVKFSNGYELPDLPYYNGYYVDINEPLLIAYPGYDYIKVGINYGDDLWFTANLTDADTASIKLNQSPKYLDIQKSRDIHYSDIQGDTTDVVFANFRNVKVGDIKDGILYRSASPVDNSHNRAPVVDRLIQNAGVNFIVNLSDDETDLVEHINKNDFNSPYFLSLYQSSKVIPLAMTAQFKEQTFKEKYLLSIGVSEESINQLIQKLSI